jgi:hypothetical protein
MRHPSLLAPKWRGERGDEHSRWRLRGSFKEVVAPFMRDDKRQCASLLAGYASSWQMSWSCLVASKSKLKKLHNLRDMLHRNVGIDRFYSAGIYIGGKEKNNGVEKQQWR